MHKLKVKKGDTVEVIAGKDSGKRGRVLRVDRDRRRVVIEGVNMIKRHTRPNPQRNVQGGIVEREASVHISNVMVVCDGCAKPSRIGYRYTEDGKKVRFCKKCNEIVDK